MNKEICPTCEQPGISPLAWLYAGWPFYAKCSYCHNRVKSNVNRYFIMAGQLISGIVFMSSVIIALQDSVIWLIFGAPLALFILLLPYYFGKLERVDA